MLERLFGRKKIVEEVGFNTSENPSLIDRRVISFFTDKSIIRPAGGIHRLTSQHEQSSTQENSPDNPTPSEE